MCVVAILALELVIPWTFSTVQVQAETPFYSTDKFDLPAYNGSINFEASGSYQQAFLDNDTWVFSNLHLTNSTPLENFRVSARDSNITISLYQAFNSTLLGIRLMYNVTGHGVQTFYFGFTPEGGEWGVIFNGNFMGENEGWRALPNGTMTITEAIGNVSIIYYVVPDELGGSGSTANQTFYQKHSVLITMSVIVAIAFVLVVANRVRNKDDKSANTVNGQEFFPANHFLVNRRTSPQHITRALQRILRKVDKNDLD